MKLLKKYWMLGAAALCIMLGLALPQIVSYLQNRQFENEESVFDLNTMNLAFQDENDVFSVLRLVSVEHTENPWEGESLMTEAEAAEAAVDIIESLDQHSLLPEGDLERYQVADLEVKPNLFVDQNGNSALVWNCVWDCDSGTFITMDDTTGKPVRILINNTLADNTSEETAETQLEKWRRYLLDTYNIDSTSIRENGQQASDSLSASVMVSEDSEDPNRVAKRSINLLITNGYSFFNYQ